MPKPTTASMSKSTNTLPSAPPEAPDAKVMIAASSDPRPKGRIRRKFTTAQKRAILAEADRCSEPGDVGALLRKHGIYSSTLSRWRAAVEKDAALRGAGRPAKLDEKDREIARLHRELERMQVRAARAEALVDLQKKLFSVLDHMSTPGQPS